MQPARDDAEEIAQSVASELLFVADCGGTKTAAWLVEVLDSESYRILAEASSSAGNPLSVGFENATQAILESLRLARLQASVDDGRQVNRALLSIAGAANREIAEKFIDWARQVRLARRVAIVSDVLPILAAGTRDCCGIALISGTGSSAFGRSVDGDSKRRGGWGYLLGDEGSGYAIGREALQLTLCSLEAGKTLSTLEAAIVRELGANSVTELTRVIYGSTDARGRIASFASIVSNLADQGEADARQILASAAADLSLLAVRTAESVGLKDSVFAIAASGSVLIHSTYLQDRLIAELEKSGVEFAFNIVREPLAGCVRLAEPRFDGQLVSWQTT